MKRELDKAIKEKLAEETNVAVKARQRAYASSRGEGPQARVQRHYFSKPR